MDGISIPAPPRLPMDHPQAPVGEPVLLRCPGFSAYLGQSRADGKAVRMSHYVVGIYANLWCGAAWYTYSKDDDRDPECVTPDGWLPIPGCAYKPRPVPPFVIGYSAALSPAGWVAT